MKETLKVFLFLTALVVGATVAPVATVIHTKVLHAQELEAQELEAQELEIYTSTPSVLVKTEEGGKGTGTLIDRSTVLTARHVVKSTTNRFKIVTKEGAVLEVKDVVRSSTEDVALLILTQKVSTDEFPYLTTDIPANGDSVRFDGCAQGGGLGLVTRKGYVMQQRVTTSSPPEVIFPDSEAYKLTFNNLLILDAPAYGGDSGAGVYDEKGKLFGIVIMKSLLWDWSYVLPVEEFKELLWLR
jgi:S1-C subfamily serine protease